VICNACQHAVGADQPALITAGRSEVPVVELFEKEHRNVLRDVDNILT